MQVAFWLFLRVGVLEKGGVNQAKLGLFWKRSHAGVFGISEIAEHEEASI
jgi:hypothetical protein